MHADWPTHRGDSARSGFTREQLPENLSLRWEYRGHHTPAPAWPLQERMQYDRAFVPIVADGLVFFGSSADGCVYALDSGNGEERWTYFTDGPVRFAPSFWKGRLLVVSDDGYLYCLGAKDGKLLWKKRGGAGPGNVLGNGRIISRWPARGGPVVIDGIVYFAAGIWPSEGVYLYAVEIESGKTLWLNDSSGSIYMPQPHGGANARSGTSAQGYLAASAEQLFVPTGRSVPAAFQRSNGKFQYFHMQKNGHRGGSDISVSDQFFLNDGIAFNSKSGVALATAPGKVLATPPGKLVAASGKMLKGYRWADLVSDESKQKSKRGLLKEFEITIGHAALSLIVADKRAVAGGADRVTVANIPAGEQVWTTEIDGEASALAVAGGRLYVSTDKGGLYCFGQAGPEKPSRRTPKVAAPTDLGGGAFAKAAEELVKRSGVTGGYCVDLSCGDGSLAYELAQRTDLMIYGIESDPDKVASARRKLAAAGLYGTRITILQGDPTKTDLPASFANLVVSGRSVTAGDAVVASMKSEMARLRRPYGGILCTGKPGEMDLVKGGPVEGAGRWTHQYGNAANTGCSDDELVRGSLEMFWFKEIDHDIPQRHGRGPAPLVMDGILYYEGLNGIIAVDAYNGHKLWTYSLPDILKGYHGDHLMGTSGTNSNFCVSEHGLFVRRKDHCLRIDRSSGELLDKFVAPPDVDGKPGTWGYIAQDGDVLFGSLANKEHVVTYRYVAGGDLGVQLTESKSLFALDAKTGKLLWRYDAEHSIRHNAIAIGNGQVVLIDQPLTLYDRKRKGRPDGETAGALVCLDAATGKEVWKETDNIRGTMLALSSAHNVVMIGYQPSSFRLASEIGGRIATHQLSDGSPLWEQKANYASRPLIVGQTIYAQGGSWDLLSGEPQPFNFKRSYGCGQLAASKHLLTFRSATLGYFDLDKNKELENFGGFRPGCWINVIPAGGLVIAPDASAGCKCSYQNQAWIALQPKSVK